MSGILSGWHVTYETGDADGLHHDSGFLDAAGDQVAAMIGRPTDGVDMGLREALALCWPDFNAGRWLEETDERLDHASGQWERRALHPPESLSPSSYRRLCRVLGIKP